MNILIIAGDIGYTAPGIVYETFIKEMSKHCNVSVLSLEIKDKTIGKNVEWLKVEKNTCNKRIENLFFTLFGRYFSLESSVNKVLRNLSTYQISKYDVVLSCVSFKHYFSLLLGYEISQKYKKKWMVYCVDAIPAPLGWYPNDLFRRRLTKFFFKYVSQADAFFSSNKQMLDYEVSYMPNYTGVKDYLYTPIRNEAIIKSKPKGNIIFLYTGGLYGPRKKEALIDGFRLFIKEYPQAKLIFVGNNSKRDFQCAEDLILSNNVEIKGFTPNLQSLYNEATALIDINAYFDNDVFLSSKIINYLPIMKPIISITGNNSPSRNIFTEDSSIIHCSHNKEEIEKALKSTMNLVSINYEQREKYLKIFSISAIAQKMLVIMSKI